MFALAKIFVTLAASLAAPKNGEKQRWIVNLSNGTFTDTLTLSFREDSANHFTVMESLASEPNFKTQSQYAYSTASGMAWRARDSTCDSSRLKHRGLCGTINSLMTRTFSFALLGNLFYPDPEGERALLTGQCSMPSNCRLGSVYVTEASRDLVKYWRSSISDGSESLYSEYRYKYGGSLLYDNCPGIQDSALFLGDSICLFASYAYYPKGPFLQAVQQIDTVHEARRIEFQMPAEGIAVTPRAIHASAPLVFRDMHAFYAWKDAQGGTSVSAIGVNGEKSTPQHGARQMFVRSQDRVYRVLILGD